MRFGLLFPGEMGAQIGTAALTTIETRGIALDRLLDDLTVERG